MTNDEIVIIALELLAGLDKQSDDISKAFFLKKGAQSTNCILLEPEEINAALLSAISKKLPNGSSFDVFYQDAIKTHIIDILSMNERQKTIFNNLEKFHRAQQANQTKATQQPAPQPKSSPGFYKEPPKVNPIVAAANAIYKQLDIIFAKAERLAAALGFSRGYTHLLALDIIKQELAKANVTFEDILGDRQAHAIFKQSERLKLILEIHQMKSAAPKGNTPQRNEAHDECKGPDNARLYAKQHAKEGEGFLTQLGLKGTPTDELGSKLRKIMAANHPDRHPNNPDAQELFNAAAGLKDLLDQGSLDDYLQSLQARRQQQRP